MEEIYLDNSATTRPLPEVVKYMTETLTVHFGNPSSLHNKGLAAEKILKKARKTIAARLRVKPEELYFTSGGTEANNMAIRGIVQNYIKRGNHLITTEIEHPSVLETYLALEDEGFEVTYLKPDKKGIINLEELKNAIRPDTILVSIMHVNNELGSIQPVIEAGEIIKEKNNTTFFHVDAIQSFGKLLVKPESWQIDLLTISGHKIHGPKGIGALFVKKGIELTPLIYGGGQEDGFRSGTENLHGIAGLIPAVRALPDLTGNSPRFEKLDRLKKYFTEKIRDTLPQAVINSTQEGAPHIIHISFQGLKGEVIVHSLEGEGIYISTGSACHSRYDQKSHVLKAIKLSPELIDGSIRISLSRYNTFEEIDYTLKKLSEQIKLFF